MAWRAVTTISCQRCPVTYVADGSWAIMGPLAALLEHCATEHPEAVMRVLPEVVRTVTVHVDRNLERLAYDRGYKSAARRAARQWLTERELLDVGSAQAT